MTKFQVGTILTMDKNLILLLFAQHKNRSNSDIHVSIGLKFGKLVGQPKENIRTKFCEDLTKILVDINDYSRK